VSESPFPEKESEKGPEKGIEKERMLSSRRIYDGRILNLRVDEVEISNGRTAVREVIEHRSAVGILPITRTSLLLARQFRYAVGEETLEICAGLVEEGEDLEEAVAREMQEELGYLPENLSKIGSFYSSPGFSTEFFTLFFTIDPIPSRRPQDDDEDVRCVEVPFEDVVPLLSKGAVRDAKTFAALSWYLALVGATPR